MDKKNNKQKVSKRVNSLSFLPKNYIDEAKNRIEKKFKEGLISKNYSKPTIVYTKSRYIKSFKNPKSINILTLNIEIIEVLKSIADENKRKLIKAGLL